MTLLTIALLTMALLTMWLYSPWLYLLGEQDEGDAHQDEHSRAHARAGTYYSSHGLQ